MNKGYMITSKNDEFYTPAYAVKPIIKYIKKGSIIWCPFDKPDSNFVLLLEKNGFKVIASHIDDGKDFFDYEPEEKYDVIISNPPFSIKDKVLIRLAQLNKPYAIILPLPTLQGQRRFNYIKDCEALIFDKRIEYSGGGGRVSFASIYVCKNFLPQPLIFEELIK